VNTPDPLGKGALFSPPAAAPSPPHVGDSPPEGRAAIFSVGPHRPGSVVVECSVCLNRTRMSALEAGVRILVGSLWVPGKHHSRWILCPECNRRTWSRIHWRG